jgi:hypothetical protein
MEKGMPKLSKLLYKGIMHNGSPYNYLKIKGIRAKASPIVALKGNQIEIPSPLKAERNVADGESIIKKKLKAKYDLMKKQNLTVDKSRPTDDSNNNDNSY